MNPAGYRQDMEDELRSILQYWMQRMPDQTEGGFFGRIDGQDIVHPDAPKGVVLNSRILWTFSAAYEHTRDAAYLGVATRAFEYLRQKFIDPVYGGVYWSLDHRGAVLQDRKQIYGLSFAIYGLAEFYRVALEQKALDHAIALFRVIEQYSYDPLRKGYLEAFARDWTPLNDLRLSPKDANEKKTMNTHLHVIEAYASLYRVWPDPLLRRRLAGLLEVFEKHIIDAGTGHLELFFDEGWRPRPGILSYGHDIEAAWLLHACAGILGDPAWLEKTRAWSIHIARAAAEGLDADGGLWYELENGRLVREKHSWPQAEAMIGFLNAWQISGERSWLEKSIGSWTFVQQYIRDRQHGEWYWGVMADHRPMPGQDKAGFWKCPYHNSRACIEVSKRIAAS